MSATYSWSLVATVVVVVASRFVLASALRRFSVPMTRAEMIGGVAGVAGLVLHCAAMFFRSAVEALPGTDATISQIRALGTASVIWYVVPAALVLLAVRRQPRIVLGLVGLSLVAVGVTMYDGGPLDVHLAAIFAAVVVLAGVAAMQARPLARVGAP